MMHSRQQPSGFSQLQKLLLISLTVIMLAGVQIVQASPLHDHSVHTFDCGLCHLQLGDDALFENDHSVAFIAAAIPYTLQLGVDYPLRQSSPYQSRAPPSAFH